MCERISEIEGVGAKCERVVRLCEELLGRVKGKVEKREEGSEGRREGGRDGQTDREGGRLGGLECALFAKALVRWVTMASSAPVLRARARRTENFSNSSLKRGSMRARCGMNSVWVSGLADCRWIRRCDSTCAGAPARQRGWHSQYK